MAADAATRQMVRRFHLVTFVVGLGGGMTAPFVPVLVDELGSSSFMAGVAVAAVGVSLLVVDLFGSRAIPRLDPARTIAAGMSCFGAGSLLSAFAGTPGAVIVSRLVQGAGAALFMGASLQAAVRLAPPHAAASAIGTYNAVWFAGISTGPFLGGAIALLVDGTSGIRLAFGVCAGVNLASAALALRWISVPKSGMRPELGLPLLSGLRRARVPAVLLLGAAGQSLRGGLALTLVPLFAVQHLGLGGAGVSLVVAVLALTDVTSMRHTTRLADVRGRSPLLAWTLVIGASGAALLAVWPGLAQLVIACSLLGVAVGAGWVLPTVMVVDIVEDAAAGLAAFRIASDVGMAAGGMAAGALAGQVGGPASFAWAAGLLVVLAAVTVAIGDTTHRPLAVVAVGALPVLEPARQPQPSAPDPVGFPAAVVGPPIAASAPPVPRSDPQPEPADPGGEPMPDVHPELIRLLAEQQGVAPHLSDERLAFAARFHASLAPKLDALRAVPLSFLEPVIEPATSLAWLERGGRL